MSEVELSIHPHLISQVLFPFSLLKKSSINSATIHPGGQHKQANKQKHQDPPKALEVITDLFFSLITYTQSINKSWWHSL